MVIDLLIIFPVVSLTALGFKDGMVKKGTALLVTFVAMIVAQAVLDDVATFFAGEFDLERPDAVLYGYFAVFFGMIFLQSLIYRLAASDYKIGGIADRTVGAVLGFFQGMLIMSVVFMMLALQQFPSRTYRIDSRLYKPVANLAPQLLDFTLNTVPEAAEEVKDKGKERLDEFGKPNASQAQPAPAQKK